VRACARAVSACLGTVGRYPCGLLMPVLHRDAYGGCARCVVLPGSTAARAGLPVCMFVCLFACLQSCSPLAPFPGIQFAAAVLTRYCTAQPSTHEHRVLTSTEYSRAPSRHLRIFGFRGGRAPSTGTSASARTYGRQCGHSFRPARFVSLVCLFVCFAAPRGKAQRCVKVQSLHAAGFPNGMACRPMATGAWRRRRRLMCKRK
jgi:hypothetical protein